MNDQKKALTLALGGRIRHYRQMRSLSQEEVALRANLNPAYFGQVERGVKCPTIDTLHRISCALEVSLEELVRAPGFTDSREGYADRAGELLASLPEGMQKQILELLIDIVKLL